MLDQIFEGWESDEVALFARKRRRRGNRLFRVEGFAGTAAKLDRRFFDLLKTALEALERRFGRESSRAF